MKENRLCFMIKDFRFCVSLFFSFIPDTVMSVKPFSSIPGPKILPVIGSAYKYFGYFGQWKKTQYHSVLNYLFKEFGPICKQQFGPNKTIVHVFNLEDIKTVYAKEGKWPVAPPLQETTQIYRAQKNMSLGLGNTNHEEWYNLRSNSQQKLLRPKEVQRHLPKVNKVAKDFVERIKRLRYINDEFSDLKSEIGRWSLENAGMLVFDTRLGCLKDDDEFGQKMLAANQTIFELSSQLKLSLPFYKVFSTPKWRKLIQAENYFYGNAIHLVDDAILRLKDHTEAGNSTEDDFYLLSYLLSRDELSLKDVTIICLSLFTDGLSTTTPALLFNLYCLAKHPESQNKVREEIKAVIGDDPNVTTEHLAKLPYLKAFIKETFRLWPNGTEVSRYIESDLVLSGYEVPSGTHVDLNPSVHFRNPEIFDKPNEHKPERWLGGGKEGIHPYLLTPFGHGARMCAGRRLAEQDMHVLLAHIVKNFRLDYPAGETIGQIYHTLLFPDKPMRVKFIDIN